MYTGVEFVVFVIDTNKYNGTRNHPVKTHCSTDQLEFESIGRRSGRSVVGAFDGGRLTSDSGMLLFREADRLFDVTGRLAACFTDHRDPARVEHRLRTLIAQRVLALAAGYEDINDHDRLRDDGALALATGCADVTGEHCVRERDRGHALAGSSTLNRLELGEPETAESDRYKKNRRRWRDDQHASGRPVCGQPPTTAGMGGAGSGRDRRQVARQSGRPVLPRLLRPLLLSAAVHHLWRAHTALPSAQRRR